MLCSGSCLYLKPEYMDLCLQRVSSSHHVTPTSQQQQLQPLRYYGVPPWSVARDVPTLQPELHHEAPARLQAWPMAMLSRCLYAGFWVSSFLRCSSQDPKPRPPRAASPGHQPKRCARCGRPARVHRRVRQITNIMVVT